MWAGSVFFPLPGCFAPIFGERRLNEHDAAAVDLPGLGEQAAERFAIDAVFLGQDLAERVSAVSEGSTGTWACMTMGPWSRCSSTKCTVQPLILTP